MSVPDGLPVATTSLLLCVYYHVCDCVCVCQFVCYYTRGLCDKMAEFVCLTFFHCLVPLHFAFTERNTLAKFQ